MPPEICEHHIELAKDKHDVKYKSEIGKKYYSLLVLHSLPTKNKRAMFLCLCDCGKKIPASGHDLRCGDKKSCGCKKYGKTTLINEIGNRYGRLLVVDKTELRVDHKATWKCKCDCGKYTNVVGRDLRSGDTKSCGCYYMESLKSRYIGDKNPMFGRIQNKNPNWKGGITLIADVIRVSYKYNQWRKAIKNKCNNVCVKCGSKTTLDAHHIKSFNDILNEFLKAYSNYSPIEDRGILRNIAMKYYPFWDLNNGVLLCRDCHSREEKHGHHLLSRTQ